MSHDGRRAVQLEPLRSAARQPAEGEAVKRHLAGGTVAQLREATERVGYYWHRDPQDGRWQIARLEDSEDDEELVRVWTLFDGGEDGWMTDAGMAHHDVEGPIAEPARGEQPA